MDKNNLYWWSVIVVSWVILIAILVVNSQYELKKNETCKSLRIRPLSEKFFSWDGILELNSKGEYQPKCI